VEENTLNTQKQRSPNVKAACKVWAISPGSGKDGAKQESRGIYCRAFEGKRPPNIEPTSRSGK